MSTSDLLQGLPATSSTGTFTREGTGGTPVLTDGLFPTPITRVSGDPPVGTPFQFGSFATAGFKTMNTSATDTTQIFDPNNSGGTSVTYTLPNASNLTSIVTFGGWQDSGRDQQAYTVSYATAVDPGTFIPLGTVNFNPSGNSDPGSHPIVTKVTIADDAAGLIASNVKLLRFDFPLTENGYAGYSEIDVNGTAVTPEPTSLSLLGLGGLGLLARRRKA